MALTEGTENNENKSNQNLDQSTIDLIKNMQKQIADLQAKQGAPQSQSNIGGLSSEQFKTFMDAVTQTKNKDLDYEAGIDESLIPEGDFNEEGVRFCVPSTGYSMTCDRRKGKIVKLPFGKKVIFFEHEVTKKIDQGKYQTIAAIASYRSHSNAEIEWIRNHSMYGVLIYESTNTAMNADMVRIQKLSKLISMLKNVEFYDLLKQCKSHNIPPSDDAVDMRMRLAHKLADDAMAAEGIRMTKMMDAAAKESLLTEAKK